MSLLPQPKIYSLKKSKRILRQAFHLVQKKKKKLSPEALTLLKEALLALQSAVLVDKEELADELAKQIESLIHTHLRKTGWEQLKELAFALGFALIVAIAVRQMWFEFYEIPTGSMRPTFKEQDRLVVSKTNFGINMPLQPKEIYFDPDLVERNNIVIFTGENMDIRDVDTMYFYLFPGKKQYVKRLIGKPGDVLYFYGGLIYGIDQQGKDITTILQPEDLAQIDHVPIIDFERKIVIYQMDEPVVKLFMTPNHQVKGEMKVPSQIHSPGAPPVSDYGDLWGIKNYALVRLLTRDQVKTLTDQDPLAMADGVLYLEIRHHPTLSTVKLIRDEQGRMRPTFG
ncbi:MAG: signal peptidase I, partial [Chlamydiota bacterium]